MWGKAAWAATTAAGVSRPSPTPRASLCACGQMCPCAILPLPKRAGCETSWSALWARDLDFCLQERLCVADAGLDHVLHHTPGAATFLRGTLARKLSVRLLIFPAKYRMCTNGKRQQGPCAGFSLLFSRTGVVRQFSGRKAGKSVRNPRDVPVESRL